MRAVDRRMGGATQAGIFPGSDVTGAMNLVLALFTNRMCARMFCLHSQGAIGRAIQMVSNMSIRDRPPQPVAAAANPNRVSEGFGFQSFA